MNPLLVCSKSTRKFLPGYDRVRIVSAAPTKDILDEVGTEENVVAIGGGAVIDTAKILSKNPIRCYPTTAAGSSSTSWSVYWDGTDKKSLKRLKPKEVIINSEFLNLPERVIEDTTFDVVSHFLDSMFSKNKTKVSQKYCTEGLDILRKKGSVVDLIRAGRLGGKAIEITGTNLLHSLSYPMTGIYGVSHGRALGYFLPKISKFMGVDVSDITKEVFFFAVDIDLIIDEALKYDKIQECDIFIDRKTLQEVLK